MANSNYYFVDEVMQIMECKRRKAYEIIGTLNRELVEKGKLVIAGRVNKKYFHSRYDVTDDDLIMNNRRD